MNSNVFHLPTFLPPYFLLVISQKSPRYNAAFFLSLRHLNGLGVKNFYFFQSFVQKGQRCFFRNQGCKPKTLVGELDTLFNHFSDKRLFAAFAP